MSKKAAYRQLLDRAADLLERPYGWVKRANVKKNRGVQAYCMIGALNQVRSNAVYNGMSVEAAERAYQRAVKQLSAQIPDSYSQVKGSLRIIRFNDRMSTRKEDVLAVMRKAADA